MASYPHNISRLTSPQMANSKAQPKPLRNRQMGMQNAATRRLQKSVPGKKMGMNKGRY